MNISNNEIILIKSPKVRIVFDSFNNRFNKYIMLLLILLTLGCQYSSKIRVNGVVAHQDIHSDGSRTLYVYARNSNERPSSAEYKCDLGRDEIRKSFDPETVDHADYGSFDGIPENLHNNPFFIYENGLFKLNNCKAVSLKNVNRNLCSRISSYDIQQYDCRREMEKIKHTKK
jgi:hypothetical protein